MYLRKVSTDIRLHSRCSEHPRRNNKTDDNWLVRIGPTVPSLNCSFLYSSVNVRQRPLISPVAVACIRAYVPCCFKILFACAESSCRACKPSPRPHWSRSSRRSTVLLFSLLACEGLARVSPAVRRCERKMSVKRVSSCPLDFGLTDVMERAYFDAIFGWAY